MTIKIASREICLVPRHWNFLINFHKQTEYCDHVPDVDDDGIELVDREGGSVLGGEAIRPLAPILHKRFVSKSEIEGVVTTHRRTQV